MLLKDQGIRLFRITRRMLNRSRIKLKFVLVCIIIFVILFFLFYLLFKRGRDQAMGDLEEEEMQYLNNIAEEKSPTEMVYFAGERLVHLDLKGAPPSINYLDQFLHFISVMGATGVLIEYEDMFPYSKELEDIKAHNAYTLADIKEILISAHLYNLTVIPLIQTFGHLEFVLKLEKYKNYREVFKYPQVLCPTHKNATSLLYMMIDQVVAAHPNSQYLHIGCDEVYYVGKCNRCKQTMAKRKWNADKLFLYHVKKIARYVMETYGMRAIVWGDKVTDVGEDLIKEFTIPQVLDVMLWNYKPDVSRYLNYEFFETNGKLFKSFWIAGAFKGATGADKIVTDRKYHLANVISWMEIVATWSDRIHFKGIALTGWQRYDHFSVLCELLPVGIPSLVTTLEFLNRFEDIDDDLLINILNCVNVNSFSNSYSELPTSAYCNFPGYLIYRTVRNFYALQQKVKSLNQLPNGWFSAFNIMTKFSSPAQVENFIGTFPIDGLKMDVKQEGMYFLEFSTGVYDEYTIKEWTLTNIKPLLVRLDCLSKAKKELLKKREWPRRPFLNITTFNDLDTTCPPDNEFCCALLFV